jgi:hypothetical protein
MPTPLLSQEILSRVDALAAKLGVTAQYLWGVLIRQAKFEAVSIFLAIGACCLVTLLVFLKYREVAAREDSPCLDDHPALSFATTGIALMDVFIVALSIRLLPTLLFNPEYYALEKVLKALGK